MNTSVSVLATFFLGVYALGMGAWASALEFATDQSPATWQTITLAVALGALASRVPQRSGE